MSKIQELIDELCPDGVEYRTLDKICIASTGVQLNKNLLLDEGQYPVLNGGINPSGYWNEYNNDKNSITISQGGASAGFVNYMETPFWAGAHCYVIKKISDDIDYKFLYYFIKSKEQKLQQCQQGAGIPGLNRKSIYELRIPVPPMEVQQEIVRVLDNFLFLLEKISAELKARQKQYEYYRDMLLTFDNAENLAAVHTHTHGYFREQKIKWVRLGDFCQLIAGGDVPNNNYSKEKNDKYSIPIYSNGIGKKALYGYTNIAKIKKPCITISARGTIGYCELRDEEFYPIIRLICVIPDERVMVKYLKYYVDTIRFSVPTTGIPQLTIPMIEKYKIPIPSLEVQEKIVNILDRFDKLCNDISEGLPAEIEARQKQYEYYRDKLLNFKELKEVKWGAIYEQI